MKYIVKNIGHNSFNAKTIIDKEIIYSLPSCLNLNILILVSSLYSINEFEK